ncbi:hypothetical protein P1X14_17245 [Sphingomonas sp. AOB5]|uniref:hypothetical protein n=1 Tax=Sphingomonas sp. AOB5 TaxID=3034017 RepID=UPI0023F73EDF|nr:hypothetical protein [Sphingomonas sp. AOB5]MDF7777006.1 hypothetical protein [Sphingomonas sp. AOB5]
MKLTMRAVHWGAIVYRVVVSEFRTIKGKIAGLGYLGLTILTSFRDRVAEWFGAPATQIERALELGFLWVTLALIVLITIRGLVRIAERRGPIPAHENGRFHSRVLSLDEVILINTDLYREVFQGTVDAREAVVGYGLNPRCILGIIETSTNRIAGWAVVLPLTADAGQQVESGSLPDENLKVSHILFQDQNKGAPYLLLLSFAIRPAFQKGFQSPFLQLATDLLLHISEEFLDASGRSARVIAAAFTDEGAHLCSNIGMEPNGCTVLYDYDPRPRSIFAGDLNRDSVMKAWQGLHRRQAPPAIA